MCNRLGQNEVKIVDAPYDAGEFIPEDQRPDDPVIARFKKTMAESSPERRAAVAEVIGEMLKKLRLED